MRWGGVDVFSLSGATVLVMTSSLSLLAHSAGPLGFAARRRIIRPARGYGRQEQTEGPGQALTSASRVTPACQMLFP